MKYLIILIWVMFFSCAESLDINEPKDDKQEQLYAYNWCDIDSCGWSYIDLDSSSDFVEPQNFDTSFDYGQTFIEVAKKCSTLKSDEIIGFDIIDTIPGDDRSISGRFEYLDNCLEWASDYHGAICVGVFGDNEVCDFKKLDLVTVDNPKNFKPVEK